MRFPGAFLLVLVVQGCGSGDDTSSSVSRVDSLGIEIVTSVIDDRPLEWSFERRFTLGGKDQGPESFYAVTGSLVDADARGRLYLLDPVSGRVVVFTPEGEFVRAMGGRGEGPGELVSPASISVSADGEASVFDFGKSALERFDSAGGVLPQQPFPIFPWASGARHFAVSPSGVWVTSMLAPAPEGQFRHGLRRIEGADTVLIADRVFPQPGMQRYASCGVGLNLPRVFEAEITWDSQGAVVVAAASPDYQLTVYGEDRPIRVMRTDRLARPATDAMARDELGEGFRIDAGRGPCTISPAEMVAERGFAEVLPWVDRIVLSPAGEVWVQRFEVGEHARGPIDVFDATGAYVGTAPSDSPFPVVFLDDDTFGAAETDAHDVTRLAVYRIRRDEGPR